MRTYFLDGTKPVFQPIRNYMSITDVQFGLPVNKNLVADKLDEDSRRILLDQFELLKEKFNISKAN